jgi:hypothetical protein
VAKSLTTSGLWRAGRRISPKLGRKVIDARTGERGTFIGWHGGSRTARVLCAGRVLFCPERHLVVNGRVPRVYRAARRLKVTAESLAAAFLA